MPLTFFCVWKIFDISFQSFREAGAELKKRGFKFDVAYTSVLRRAVFTTWSVLKGTECAHIPVVNSWRCVSTTLLYTPVITKVTFLVDLIYTG